MLLDPFVAALYACGVRCLRVSGAALLVVALLAPAAPAAEPSAPAEAPKPPVGLRIGIGQRGPEHPWILRLDNTSNEPLRVVSDPRLLWFEATVPGKKKPVRCELPAGMRPDDVDPDAMVTIAPGARKIRTFDPRFYCFPIGKDKDVLVPGTTLVSHYGFPPKTKTSWKRGKRVEERLPDTPPFIAEPADPERESDQAPIKSVDGNSITLDERYAEWVSEPEEKDKRNKKGKKDKKNKKDEEPVTNEPVTAVEPDPELVINKGVDAQTERSVVVTATFKNPRKSRLKVFFRRENITYEVLGPEGLVECDAGPDDREPEPTAFSNLGAGGSTSVTSRLVELCQRGTFARPGFYLIHARFEGSEDGREWDIVAYTGSVRTKRPVPVRVRTGEQPFLLAPRPQPGQDKPGAPGQPATPGQPAAGSPPPAPGAAPQGAPPPGALPPMGAPPKY